MFPLVPYINPAGVTYPLSVKPGAAVVRDRGGMDGWKRISMGNNIHPVGTTAEITTRSIRLPPGMYRDTFLQADVPQAPKGLWPESAFAFIASGALSAGDQPNYITFTDDSLVTLFEDAEIESTCALVREHVLHLGVTDPTAFQPGGNVSFGSQTSNPWTIPTGNRVRIPIPTSWFGPDSLGMTNIGDSYIMPGERTATGMNIELTVTLADLSHILQVDPVYSHTAADWPAMNYSLVLVHQAKSTALTDPLFKLQAQLKPYATSYSLDATKNASKSIPFGIQDSIDVDLRDVKGIPRFLIIKARWKTDMENGNKYTSYVDIDDLEVSLEGDTIYGYSDPVEMSRQACIDRTGEAFGIHRKHGVIIPIGNSFDMHNIDGATSFSNSALVTLTATNNHYSGNTQTLRVDVGVIVYAAYGPSATSSTNEEYAAYKSDELRGGFEAYIPTHIPTDIYSMDAADAAEELKEDMQYRSSKPEVSEEESDFSM